MVGLGDLKHLFQPEQFHGSLILGLPLMMLSLFPSFPPIPTFRRLDAAVEEQECDSGMCQGRHGGAARFPSEGSHKAMQSFPFPWDASRGIRVVQPRVSVRVLCSGGGSATASHQCYFFNLKFLLSFLFFSPFFFFFFQI